MRTAMFSLLLVSTTISTANAQETIDVGALQNKDFKVVQKQLYDKENLKELAIHGALMPFDAFSITPKIDVTYAKYFSDTMAWEVAIGGGYSIKNGNYKQLEGAAYGISPDVYRHLGSVIGDVQWAPIYAKMAMDGKNIFHYDVYGIGGGGLSVEQSFLPDKDLSFAPTVTLGIGSRIFLANGSTLRVQLRDDFLFQQRAKTIDSQTVYLKQNITLSVGYTFDLRKIADDTKEAVKDGISKNSKKEE
jgi:outer membrane beta-barrel protein